MKSIFPIVLVLVLLLSACGTSSSETPTSSSTTTQLTTLPVSDMFQQDPETPADKAVMISLTGDSASCSQKGVHISGNTVTIQSPGSYCLSGSLNGMIVVDAKSSDTVQLLLQNASVQSPSSAALYVKQAEKVILTLEGSNTLSNQGEFAAIDENNIDGAVFSKDNLTINGTGSLHVDSTAHGIVCKDTLVLSDGVYTINTQRHSISANDSVRIAKGQYTLSAGGDCIHGENTEDSAKGFVYIADGSFQMEAEGDCIDTSAYLQIDNGSFQMKSGGGQANAAPHFESFGNPFGGNTSTSDTDSVSTKGMKAQSGVILHNGSFVIDSADDAVHSNADLQISGGSFEIQSGDDGLHADVQLLIEDGTININRSYEGLEGHCIDIQGGITHVVASDDGLNAAGGNDGSGLGGRDDIFAVDADAYVSISGGELYVDAGGDGVDSNGALRVSGGCTYVSGPTNNGNGALDFAGEAVSTGGIFVAAGSSGMATGFGKSSTQGAIFVSYNTQPAGSTVSLTNAAGEVLLSWQTTKNSSSIVLSCPGIVKGESYHLVVGAIEGDITMTDIIYGTSSGMPGGGGGGGRPGGGRR